MNCWGELSTPSTYLTSNEVEPPRVQERNQQISFTSFQKIHGSICPKWESTKIKNHELSINPSKEVITHRLARNRRTARADTRPQRPYPNQTNSEWWYFKSKLNPTIHKFFNRPKFSENGSWQQCHKTPEHTEIETTQKMRQDGSGIHRVPSPTKESPVVVKLLLSPQIWLSGQEPGFHLTPSHSSISDR